MTSEISYSVVSWIRLADSREMTKKCHLAILGWTPPYDVWFKMANLQRARRIFPALSRHVCGIPRFRKIPELLIELKYSYVLLQISMLVLNLRVVPNFNRNGLRIHLALAGTQVAPCASSVWKLLAHNKIVLRGATAQALFRTLFKSIWNTINCTIKSFFWNQISS